MSFKVGDKVTFHRGMFGRWPGKIRRVNVGTRNYEHKGKLVEVSFQRANGTYGRRTCHVDNVVLILDAPPVTP